MEAVVKINELQLRYRDSKVFVTGHTGFKGAWLMALLYKLGAKTKGYALAPEYTNGLFNLLPVNTMNESVIADIRNRERLSHELQSFKPDYIFHLAAQPLVRRSYMLPAETFEINVVGTANLLESVAALDNKCAVVIVTTDKVYENKEKHILYKEDDALGGFDPYSASKACTELVVNSFRNSFFNPTTYGNHQKAVASARAGNVIGGGDWSIDRIVPDIVRSLQSGQKIDVRNPGAIRPWQHVLEPLTGYLLLAAALYQQPAQFSRAFNFGPYPNDHLDVKTLVMNAIAAWGQGEWRDVSGTQELHEATLLQLDIGRAIEQLDWRPRLLVDDAIKWTIEWYKQPLAKQADFTFEQIMKYLAI